MNKTPHQNGILYLYGIISIGKVILHAFFIWLKPLVLKNLKFLSIERKNKITTIVAGQAAFALYRMLILLIFLNAPSFLSVGQENRFPLYSSGAYNGAVSGDHTNVANAQLKLESTSGYIRVPHVSAHASTSAVYNYQTTKNVYWGEPLDQGSYIFRGRNVAIGSDSPSLWFAGKVLEISDERPVLKLNSNSLSTILFTNRSVNATTHAGEFHMNYLYNATEANLSKINFFAYPAGDVFSMRSNGQVGIGTSSPSHQVTIEGRSPGNAVQANVYNPSSASESVAGVRFHTASGWNVMLRTRQDKSWLELTGGTGNVVHYWDAGNYFATGKIAIGTTDIPGNHRLYVNGSTVTTEVNVKLKSAWPDYVFSNAHKLLSLIQLDNYIKENKHLPEVPSAVEVKEHGVNIGEMNALLLKKVEELTLYIIELHKNNILLQEKNSLLEKDIEAIKNLLNKK